MSDTPQGPGWWQASDGKWYPPEQAPGASPTPGGGGGVSALDTGAALSYGWNKFVQYIGQIIIIVLVIFAVQFAFGIARGIVQGAVDNSILGFILATIISAAGFFIALLLQAGLIRAALAVTRGEAPEASMLFSTENFGPYVIGAIIVALLSFVGLLVCCVGILVVMFFTLFWGYYVIDRGTPPVDAIKASFDITKRNASAVLVFAIVVIVLNLITCGLAIGVTSIALAYAYKTLNGEAVAT